MKKIISILALTGLLVANTPVQAGWLNKVAAVSVFAGAGALFGFGSDYVLGDNDYLKKKELNSTYKHIKYFGLTALASLVASEYVPNTSRWSLLLKGIGFHSSAFFGTELNTIRAHYKEAPTHQKLKIRKICDRTIRICGAHIEEFLQDTNMPFYSQQYTSKSNPNHIYPVTYTKLPSGQIQIDVTHPIVGQRQGMADAKLDDIINTLEMLCSISAA